MNISIDYEIIKNWIPEKSKVIDLGCGSGDLMYFLKQKKDVLVSGIEISEECIYECVGKGLSVLHSDIEQGLQDFPDKSFDFVIFYQTLQQIRSLNFAVSEALRIGREVIVCFPNFAYYDSRFKLFFCGIAPVTENLPYRWDNTPNVHFFSIKDFENFCGKNDIKISGKFCLRNGSKVNFMPNFFADRAIMKISN